MSQLYGVGQDITIKRIILDLKLYISQKNGKLTLRQIYQIFLDQDQDRQGFIKLDLFQKCLQNVGFVPKVVDMQAISLHYKINKNDIEYNRFIMDLQDPLNERRENFLQKVISTFDPENQGKISIELLKQNYQPNEKNSENILRFINSFECEFMTTDDFFYFFYDLSLSLYSDTQFIQILSKSFGLSEDQNQFVSQEEIKSVIKQIRYKLVQSTPGVHEEFKVRKIFQDLDVERSGFLQLNTLKAFLLRLDIKLQQRYLNALFKKFDTQNNGLFLIYNRFIDFEVFVNFLIMNTYP